MSQQTTAHAGVSGRGPLGNAVHFYRATFCMKGLRTTDDRSTDTVAISHYSQHCATNSKFRSFLPTPPSASMIAVFYLIDSIDHDPCTIQSFSEETRSLSRHLLAETQSWPRLTQYQKLHFP